MNALYSAFDVPVTVFLVVLSLNTTTSGPLLSLLFCFSSEVGSVESFVVFAEHGTV
jgi:hypothetical protein